MSLPDRTMISTASLACIGLQARANGFQAIGAGAVWPSANRAIFVPLLLRSQIQVKRLFALNAAAVSGNIDVGIYTFDGTLIVSTGGTAQLGIVQPQFFDITDLTLPPGKYYLAAALDNITGTNQRSNPAIVICRGIGILQMATAYPLPTTAVFATVASAYIPAIGIETVRGI